MGSEAGTRHPGATGDSRTVSSPPTVTCTDMVRVVAEVTHETIDRAHRAGDKSCTYRGLARGSEVPHQHIHDWTNPLSGRSPRAAVLFEVLGPRRAVQWCERAAAKLRSLLPLDAHGPCDLRDAALGVQESAGRLAQCVREVLRDDHITDEEDAAIEATLLAAEAHIAAVRAARAQHRARGGAR